MKILSVRDIGYLEWAGKVILWDRTVADEA
jgi:hypothetical protein